MGFPNAPSNGQTAVVNGITYTYDSTRTAWIRSSTTAFNLYTASNIAPSVPKLGDQWYYIATDVLYEYISDGTSSYWVDVDSLGQVGNITTIADATLQGNVVVGVDSIYSIGASNGYVKNVYANNITANSITVNGNIIPSANVTYNLGSTTNRFKDLWLSGNTIYLGGASMSTDGENVTISNPRGGSFSVAGTSSGSANVSFGNVFANYYFANGAAFTSSSYGNTEVSAYLRSSNTVVGTGAITIPSGTTAQRAGNVAGALRLNTTTNYVEIYTVGGIWANLIYAGGFITASGGTVTTSGNFKIHTFTSTGSFIVSDAPPGSTAEVLLIGGGGGGGTGFGGGGGAGGYYYDQFMSISPGSLTVTIGAGGTNAAGSLAVGSAGANTTFNSASATGGGGGGAYNATAVATAGNGGSGGGAGGAGTSTANRGTGSQGGNGGVGVGTSTTDALGGGGGGSAAVGSAASGSTAGSGGVGTANPITGSTAGQLVGGIYYLAGGGGGGGGTGSAGSGGSGGGGAGQIVSANGFLPQSVLFTNWTFSTASVTSTNNTAPDGTATATQLNVSASAYSLYYTISGLTGGVTYYFTMWVKLGTCTNWCVVPNNTSAWNTVAGAKAYTSADGLNSSTWTKIVHTFVSPGSAVNMHLGAHSENITQQTAGTIQIWGPICYATSPAQATSGTANTGGGGGGGGAWSTGFGGSGGSGLAIIRYRYQ